MQYITDADNSTY